ncbi:putative amino acid/polyamine transporter I [Helianthus anomalus]
MAFLTGANLIMDYVFSNAAVARSFTTYLGTAIGVSAESKWRITITSLLKGFNQINFIAVLVIIILTVIICYSTRESSVLNMILTALHIIFIIFVIIMGFWRGDSKNFTEPSDPTRPVRAGSSHSELRGCLTVLFWFTLVTLDTTRFRGFDAGRGG